MESLWLEFGAISRRPRKKLIHHPQLRIAFAIRLTGADDNVPGV